MVDFAGWDMPVQYTSIVQEHHAVRTAAGMFDIAHMGRLVFSGPEAGGFLDRLLTNDVSAIEEGRVRYALVCDQSGGILDDVLVYRFAEDYLLVVNASNRQKILEWIETHRAGFDVTVIDRTIDWAMLAVQGPRAVELVAPLVDSPVADLGYYRCASAIVMEHESRISRTGYTGEDGVELIVPAGVGPEVWQRLMELGAAAGLVAAGLGCRDTLRLEAAMPLYGHELSEDIDPYTAGLAFAVKPDAAEFIGRESVVELRDQASRRRRIGLRLEGRRIAREGAAVFSGDEPAGEVTSGTFSPTLEESIAMAYVDEAVAEEGTALVVDIRGHRVDAMVVGLPFYKRA